MYERGREKRNPFWQFFNIVIGSSYSKLCTNNQLRLFSEKAKNGVEVAFCELIWNPLLLLVNCIFEKFPKINFYKLLYFFKKNTFINSMLSKSSWFFCEMQMLKEKEWDHFKAIQSVKFSNDIWAVKFKVESIQLDLCM